MLVCRGQCVVPRGPSLRSEGIRSGDVGREGRSLSRTSPPRHPCTGNRVGNGTQLPPPVPRSHHCPPPSGSCHSPAAQISPNLHVCVSFVLFFCCVCVCLNPSLFLTSWLTGLDCAAAVGWWQILSPFHEKKSDFSIKKNLFYIEMHGVSLHTNVIPSSWSGGIPHRAGHYCIVVG